MKKYIKNVKIKSWVKDIIVFVLSFFLFMTIAHFIRFPEVDGNSMYPTYNSGDRLVVLYTKNVKNNDIAVLWNDQVNEYIVKRVIGVAGDHIEIKNGQLYRNEQPIYESYIKEHSWAEIMNSVDVMVPDGYIYVLGDNRNESADSRLLGLLETDDIFGRVITYIKK